MKGLKLTIAQRERQIGGIPWLNLLVCYLVLFPLLSWIHLAQSPHLHIYNAEQHRFDDLVLEDQGEEAGPLSLRLGGVEHDLLESRRYAGYQLSPCQVSNHSLISSILGPVINLVHSFGDPHSYLPRVSGQSGFSSVELLHVAPKLSPPSLVT